MANLHSMRRRIAMFALAAFAAVSVAMPSAHAAPVISDVVVVALKTGRRLAVTWRTDTPTVGVVRYRPVVGQELVAPPVSVREHADAGTDHLIVIDVVAGDAVEYELTITAVAADGSSAATDPMIVRAENATTAYDAGAESYTANLLMRFDWDLTSAEMTRWAQHATEFARRVNDMTDGWVRLGTVILADSAVRDVIWSEDCATTDCLSGADVVVFTGYGYSDYVAGRRVTVMWQQTRAGGINSMGSAIEFPRYVFWGGTSPVDMTNEWWTGRRLAHEFGHYGLWLTDQYDGPVCANGAYDISIMNNDLAFSEIDSVDTPCDWQDGGHRNSWDTYLMPHYENIRRRLGPPDPGPTDAGSAFRLVTLNRGIA